MQFAIYRLPGAERGYVVDIQSDLFSGLRTRVMIPLYATRDAPSSSLQSLNPIFELAGLSYVLMTQHMAAVPIAELGEPVASLNDRRDDIIRAMDVLISGV